MIKLYYACILVFWGLKRKRPVPFVAIPGLEGALPCSLAQLEPRVPSRCLMTCRFIPRQWRDLPPSRNCRGNDHLIQKKWFNVMTCKREMCHILRGPKCNSQSSRGVFPGAGCALVLDPVVIREQHWRPKQPETCPTVTGTSTFVVGT